MAVPDAADPSQRPQGFLHGFQSYLRTWVDLLHTRAELFTNELEEERDRLQLAMILTAAAAFCLMFGVLLLTLLVVAAFWDTEYRLVVLGGFSLLYLAAGAIVAFIAWRKLTNRPRLFAASLGELSKDYEQLSSKP